jgi:hypothetical protein
MYFFRDPDNYRDRAFRESRIFYLTERTENPRNPANRISIKLYFSFDIKI